MRKQNKENKGNILVKEKQKMLKTSKYNSNTLLWLHGHIVDV